MNIIPKIKNYLQFEPRSRIEAFNFLKYLGPGLLITIGFIDPGNWAANVAAGSAYGYSLLWIVTLSTLMLILLQHNVAHLGIATGLCLSEAATYHTKKYVAQPILISAMLASISTSLAEILGGSIALNMIFNIPVKIAAILIIIIVFIILFTNSYKRIEKLIIGFVSIIGFSFLYELFLVDVQWGETTKFLFTPNIPDGSILIIMSTLGAVVMPHNLFLHSEIIQSRHWELKDEKIRKKQLDYEFFDTLFSMIIGWAINGAMIILAAAVFFKNSVPVGELQQAKSLLEPLLGKSASLIFALGLLFSGVSSSITSGMAGGSIFAGIFGEPYDAKDKHTKIGISISLIIALFIIFIITDLFKGLLISQMILSIQLPFTIFLQIYLTSSKKVMGKYSNKLYTKILLILIGGVISYLNIKLFMNFIF